MNSTSQDLASQSCESIKNAKKLKGAELQALLGRIHPSWRVNHGETLEREFAFKDFKMALHFTTIIGDLAEREHHHPSILLKWGSVKVSLQTHDVHGITEKDFILAAKIDESYLKTPHLQDF